MLTLLVGFLCAFADPWRTPPEGILEVLHAPELPSSLPSPDGEWLLQVVPVRYPALREWAAPMLPLAGIRVDPHTGGFFARTGSNLVGLVSVADGRSVPVPMPADVRVLDVAWAADGRRLALVTKEADHVGLWIGSVDGAFREIEGLALSPLLGEAVRWTPDQRHLLVRRVPPERGQVPAAPAIPVGPVVRESGGGLGASSTYEARDLLTSPYDEALFEHFATVQIAVVEVDDGTIAPVGAPGVYGEVSPSPDGRFLLARRLTKPWSHRTAWWRFAHRMEVWDAKGELVRSVANLPAAEEVPIHGVPVGPRDMRWQSTAPATLVWTEALDGGDPMAKVPHRDRLLALNAPFPDAPREVFRAEHRVEGIAYGDKGLAIVWQFERERRWSHVWTADMRRGAGSAAHWYDLSTRERYADPGNVIFEMRDDGTHVVRQDGSWIFFAGAGSTPQGDRPFLDRRMLGSADRVERWFRSEPEVLERFVAFHGDRESSFLIRREGPAVVPNVHVATLGARVKDAPASEARYARTDRAVTAFADPTPQLRGISKRIVTTTRADGTQIAFTLYLPAGYVEGTPLPTVLHAYPREFSDPGTAGQIGGSEKTYLQLVGPTELFFLLDGYAVMQNTTMPVIGDPDTAYDTFVEQLVASAEAAIDEAVRMGVADRDRIGVMGHSHGGLMAATLLAHSDLFRAGIARSGAYNHTLRPFGFQSERRTLWDAKDTYLRLSPALFAPDIDEPLLLVHGAIDENPGTVPLQSERLFEAVRGSGGTARLVMLPLEGHGYQAKESVEHVLWEQLAWVRAHVKEAPPRARAVSAGGE